MRTSNAASVWRGSGGEERGEGDEGNRAESFGVRRRRFGLGGDGDTACDIGCLRGRETGYAYGAADQDGGGAVANVVACRR